MTVFEEMLWPQFVKLNRIRNLPLNEQVREYNRYLDELSLATQRWLDVQPKGPAQVVPIETFFLLQENGDYILQENNNKIIIT